MPFTRSATELEVGRWRWRVAAVLALSLPIFVWVARATPLAQDPRYHDFIDQRQLLGVPHFWNVMSNLPFAVIGLLGCWWLIRAGKSIAWRCKASRPAGARGERGQLGGDSRQGRRYLRW